MPPPEIDIFAAHLDSVTAPAGCGKTQLITDALNQHTNPKPVLVLTHTNTNVTALRAQLKRDNVPSTAYHMSTINNFAIQLTSKFPVRTKLDTHVLELANPNNDYPAIRGTIQQLLQTGHINNPITATYSRILVDEYQNYNQTQHTIVCAIAQTLPTCMINDPIQTIFGFQDPLVH